MNLVNYILSTGPGLGRAFQVRALMAESKSVCPGLNGYPVTQSRLKTMFAGLIFLGTSPRSGFRNCSRGRFRGLGAEQFSRPGRCRLPEKSPEATATQGRVILKITRL